MPKTDSNTLASDLEQARKRLLDLTTRNRLLSVPQKPGAKLLRIVDESSEQVFRMLVTERRKFSFLEQSEPAEASGESEDLVLCQPAEVEEISDGAPIPARHTDTRLQTELGSETLQRRLLSLYYDARTAIEEQGVNTLFLALGKLRWRDSEDSDIDRFAPLLLIPVELERTKATARFRLQATEQEPSDNLSLAEKLKEFGIRVPEFNLDDTFSPSDYFARFAEAVSGQKAWEVLPDRMVLGFFSFAKFLMFRDLNPSNWPQGKKLEDHKLVRALLREGFDKQQAASIPEDAFLDELIPVQRLGHVVDADSSQALAIEEVRLGNNLIIQGPPGTGKSQTITNLIATAVQDGKRVLFVAEKLAALEVVKRRLDSIGLGPIALELHSHRTNKKAVLEELGRTLPLGKPKPVDRESALSRLDHTRGKLNAHAARLNQSQSPHGFSALHVIGQLSLLGALVHDGFTSEAAGAENWSPSERMEREALISGYSRHLVAVHPIADHPWRGVGRATLTKFEAEEVNGLLSRLSERIARLQETLSRLSNVLGTRPAGSMADGEVDCKIAAYILSAPDFDKQTVGLALIASHIESLRQLLEKGRQLRERQATLLPLVSEAAWVTDLSATRISLAAHGRSVLRLLNKDFRQAVARLNGLMKDGKAPKRYTDRLELVDNLIICQGLRSALDAQADLAASAYGTYWAGRDSDWESLVRITDWVGEAKRQHLPESVFETYLHVGDKAECGSAMEQAQAALSMASDAGAALFAFLSLDPNAAFGVTSLAELPLDLLVDRIGIWHQAEEQLHQWALFINAQEEAHRCGLEPFVSAISSLGLDPETVIRHFRYACFRRLYRVMVEADPALAAFDGHSHEALIREFRSHDLKRIKIARYETLLAHHDHLPLSSATLGEMGILRGELARKRGHMPIRKLLGQAGSAVQAVKPVFMMSPLSVAQFIEPGGIEFDIVVFDEASQVQPVDALGAIARGSQLVVVGDEKQLPPTMFFSRMGTEDEETNEEDAMARAGDMESVLGLAKSKGMRDRMLRWHYRSRHQSLIAVSNHEFYDNRLYIIPSPQNGSTHLGLRLDHIEEGVFDRGRSKCNRLEAKKVAQAVIQHALECPNKSLGVAAFSVSQRDAIIDELELLRRQHPETETFFASHPFEKFFVKNLENVQGDERDFIFISVGYAKDSSGFFSMNFGPLNNEGGERRLNVLISRAKEQCRVFTSIRSDEIDLGRSQAIGVRALKTFLRFAETKILGVPRPEMDREADSPFEESVRLALESAGYTVHSQVGTAGFFIDLAILDPNCPGRYLIGIECDGATYHSARSARERDRQRQQVLEDHGWRIHRIWSADWFARPRDQLAKAVQAIEAAKLTAPAPPATKAGSRGTKEPSVGLDREPPSGIEMVDALRGLPYEEAAFKITTRLDIHEVQPAYLADVIERILEVEAPLHLEELVTRVRTLWGVGRAGVRINDAVATALRILKREDKVCQEGHFLTLPGTKVVVRDRSAASSRSLKSVRLLPPEEIRLALLQLVEVNLGVGEDDLCTAVARLLGFQNTSQQLKDCILEEIQTLLASTQLRRDNGWLRLADENNNPAK